MLLPTTYQYRDIKQLDLDTFQRRLKSATLITSTFNTPDEYLDEIQRVVGEILDNSAPLRTGKRPGGKGSSRWHSPEAMAAKKDRRRLERRWKLSKNESDRREYRAVCWQANKLIYQSRNEYRCQLITNAAGNCRRVWSEVRDLLHASPPTDTKSNEECQHFSALVAAFSIKKVRDIRSRISIVLNGAAPNPMTFDPQHIGITLSNMTSVTVDEVKDILTSMSESLRHLILYPHHC